MAASMSRASWDWVAMCWSSRAIGGQRPGLDRPSAWLGPAGAGASLDLDDSALLADVKAAYDPGDQFDPLTKNRRNNHAEAIGDLERVLRHRLSWALYLRNFDHANKLHMLTDPIAHEQDRSTRIVVPQITYSLVDHNISELFEEGVITVADPRSSFTQRKTPIPMLSLYEGNWLGVVGALVRRCKRIVMLLDELTPGVQCELDLLNKLGAARRTLIVCGHDFRIGKSTLPEAVTVIFRTSSTGSTSAMTKITTKCATRHIGSFSTNCCNLCAAMPGQHCRLG